MGLRQRTSIALLREQRQLAEIQSKSLMQHTQQRTIKKLHFSSYSESQTQVPFFNHLEQDESDRLIKRLREALQPHSQLKPTASNLVNKEYVALQDELQRLTQHLAQYRPASITAPIEDVQLPVNVPAEDDAEQLPYRMVQISINASRPESKVDIRRIDFSLLDLEQYKLGSSKVSSSQPTLTLVQNIPDAQDLLINEELELGIATAQLTQHSLQAPRSRAITVEILPEVVISLLDS